MRNRVIVLVLQTALLLIITLFLSQIYDTATPKRLETALWEYVIVMKSFLNPEGHQNCMSGEKVTIILLKALILPIGKGVRLQPAEQDCLLCISSIVWG